MPDDALAYDDLPWAAAFSVQAQLKRLADVLLSASLLLVTAPFVVLAALLIWLEDQGPIFYTQQRSGWLGEPFKVLKLRTMNVQSVMLLQRGQLRDGELHVWVLVATLPLMSYPNCSVF